MANPFNTSTQTSNPFNVAKFPFAQFQGQEIRATPRTLLDRLPKPIQGIARTLKEGFIGRGQEVDITGQMKFDTGLLGFALPLGIGKPVEKKVLDRVGLLQPLVDAGTITPQRADELAREPFALSQMEAMKKGQKWQPPTKKTKEERTALMPIMVEEALTKVFGALDVVSLGTLKPLTRTASQAIAKSKIWNEIADILIRENPTIQRPLADEMGKILVHIDDPIEVQAVLNRTEFALQESRKASVVPTQPPTTAPTSPVAKSLNAPLLQEARKFKTSEEFVKAQTELSSLQRRAREFDKSEDFISHYRGSATQYGGYTPELRKFGTTENSARISDLGIDPNKKITIYRGIDDVDAQIKGSRINDGDFVTTDFDSAKSYTGGRVVSKEVKAKDLITDFPDEFNPKDPFYTGAEFIYSDSKNKLVRYSDTDLADIFNKAKTSKLSVKSILELEKETAYILKYGKTPSGADMFGFGKSPEYGKYGNTSKQQTSAYYEYVDNKIIELTKTKSQLTAIWNEAQKVTPIETLKVKPTETLGKVETPVIVPKAIEGAESLQEVAQQKLGEANRVDDSGAFSLPKSIASLPTPVNKKVHLLDYIRTPDRVLQKIGLGEETKFLREQYDKYLKELPTNIEQITRWSKEVPKESNQKIFKWLDGQVGDLNSTELRVGNEIKTWLAEWADRLNLPKDNRISNYITHLFDDQLIKKEFDEDLAKIIADKIPGSVYDPFLLKRLGAKGFIEDTWKALDAYVKRATRKVHLDPALAKIEAKASGFEKSQFDFVKNYIDRVNMRPTDIDTLLDNGMKNLIGYRLGQRPTLVITRLLRQMTYRAMLGLNLSSALKNISQGVNTFAKLGTKYTTLGYVKLFSSGANEELLEQGIMRENFIQDRTISATKKTLEKIDKGLFFFFEQAERINRGSAYFGAKAKALAEGKTPEQAIEFAKKIVRDTQFVFGSIDTPIFLQSDIGKTLGQFQSFTVKQIEFLAEMVRNKELAGLIRYAISGMAFVYTVGKAFGMEPKDLIPAYRLGVPPSLKFPVETIKALLDTPSRYGKERDLRTKLGDVGKSFIGLVPAGIQAKKTIEGIRAVQEGRSTTKSGQTQFMVGETGLKKAQAVIFGKYASPEAKKYFNPPSKKAPTKSNPFNI